MGQRAAVVLTDTPQPEALTTIASTGSSPPRPSTCGHRGVDVAAHVGQRTSWSPRWSRTAPQQSASSETRVWMPQASSTRAVALLMLGASGKLHAAQQHQHLAGMLAGRPALRMGQRAGARLRRHLVLQHRRQQRARSGRHAARRTETRRGHALARHPAHAALDGCARPLRRRPCGRSRAGRRTRRPTAGGLAAAAGQAVQMLLGAAGGHRALHHLLDQVDAPARAVEPRRRADW